MTIVTEVAAGVNPWHRGGMSNDDLWRRKYGRMRFGSIVFDDGTVVPLDWRDLMWLVRGFHGEDSSGLSDAAMGWVLTNRLRLYSRETIGRGEATHDPPHRLFHVALAFMQPINPYWRDRGTPEEIARRHHHATMGPSDALLKPHSIPNVLLFLRAAVSRAPYMQWTNWSACGSEGPDAGDPVARINDCFFITPGGRTLNERSVYISPPRGSAGGVAAGVSLSVVGGAGLLYLAR